MPQSLPQPAREYAAAQSREIARAIGGVTFAWRRMDDDLDASWARIAPEVQAVMDEAQRRIVSGATAYVPDILAETSPTALRRRPEYTFSPSSIIGTAGDGLGTDTLAYEAVIATKVAIRDGASTAAALNSGRMFLQTAVGTMLSDTGRAVEKVGANARGVGSYVRMLTPPSCGRCVILAGRVYHRQDAFDRHPGCDCRNIPAAESDGADLTVNPGEYLDSLDDAGLRKALGSKANAQAYRDGADVNQLINAYRRAGSVRPAQMAMGRTVKVTTEGMTRRGTAYKAMRNSGLANPSLDVRRGRYFGSGAARLMPESIYKIARDADEAQSLLRAYGWIF